jgi:hypothetical protein
MMDTETMGIKLMMMYKKVKGIPVTGREGP